MNESTRPPVIAARCDPRKLDLAVGGQAVIEGVMMRTPSAVATAVRAPDGRIIVRKSPFRSIVRRFRPLSLPVLRGGVHLLESLAVGVNALMFAADQASAETSPAGTGAATRVERPRRLADQLLMWGTLVFAFALGLGLFFYLPLVLTDLLRIEHSFWFNVVDGIFRIVIFVLYLWGVSRLPDMRRVFQYHGAEHKSIHAFENGRGLTVEETRSFATLHPRCGTSFLFFVMLLAIIVFAFLGRPETVGERLLRLLFVPLIGGLAYEAIKLSGRFRDHPVLRLLIWPGLMLQKITTKQPDDTQQQVGLVALQAALEPEPEGFGERVFYWPEEAGAAAQNAAPGS